MSTNYENQSTQDLHDYFEYKWAQQGSACAWCKAPGNMLDSVGWDSDVYDEDTDLYVQEYVCRSCNDKASELALALGVS